MSETEISGILKDLAESKERTETSKLRDVFNEVNFALQRGVSQAIVLEHLKKIGFTFGINGFKYSFNKIRKERGIPLLRKKKGELTPPTPATAPISSPALNQQAAIQAQTKTPPRPSEKSEEPRGIIDIFTIQAEREEEKKRNPKRQILRRL